jgi:ATP-dependent exoDNAse (exonuclease V) alpha subunit
MDAASRTIPSSPGSDRVSRSRTSIRTRRPLQFTAPDRTRDVANRDLATIEHIDPNGRLQVRLDSGRSVTFEPQERRHLDYGYAVTSHSSQGQTTDRVLVHVETDRASEKLVNRRLAYVAVSRGRYDAQLCTDDKEKLRRVLDRDVSHSSARLSHETPGHQRRRTAPHATVGPRCRQLRQSPSLIHESTVLGGVQAFPRCARRLRRA